MKHFARMRRSAGVVALAGLAVAGVIGFVHDIQPDPGWVGGLQQPGHLSITSPNVIDGMTGMTCMACRQSAPAQDPRGDSLGQPTAVSQADAPLTGF